MCAGKRCSGQWPSRGITLIELVTGLLVLSLAVAAMSVSLFSLLGHQPGVVNQAQLADIAGSRMNAILALPYDELAALQNQTLTRPGYILTTTAHCIGLDGQAVSCSQSRLIVLTVIATTGEQLTLSALRYNWEAP